MRMIVYTKTGCPWCREVLGFLEENKIEFEERNVSKSREYLEEMIKKSGQVKAPTLDVDGEILADTDVETVEKFLKDKNKN